MSWLGTYLRVISTVIATTSTTVRFSSRGRVTISAVWRRRHGLQVRTRVVVAATESGNLLKRVGRVRH